LYVEFSNNEIMAVVPVFTMEVSNEKQSNWISSSGSKRIYKRF
jgi:hypothetical protein